MLQPIGIGANVLATTPRHHAWSPDILWYM